MSTAEVVNAYLLNRFGIALERLLLDAASGIARFGLPASIELVCDPVGSDSYEDGGVADHYTGHLSVEGVTYRFLCSVFTDAGGARFIETIAGFEAVTWTTRLAVPKMAAGRS
jgi:hypothetical protein